MANVAQTIIVSSTVAVLTLLVYNYWRKQKKLVAPTVWEPVARVKHLFIYPLKSGHQIPLLSAVCTKYGFKIPPEIGKHQFSDRSLIIYKDDFVFVTARQHSKIIFIKTAALNDNSFTLNAPEMPEIKVCVPSNGGGKKMEQVT